MSSGFQKLVTEDRRLVVLRLLAESESYTANEYLLTSALPGFGHSVSHDRVRADMDWLEEQGLVSVERPGDISVAKLTQRGLDVAQGRTRATGVKRPAPGE
jgi:Fe2+ or Zn2+ uptake regulation protein